MRYIVVIAVGLTLAVNPLLAQQTKLPVVSADDTAVPQPPKPVEPDVKGYGTRGVEGATLKEMVTSCQVKPLTRLKAARCAQLKRSLKTQPDGTVAETLQQLQ